MKFLFGNALWQLILQSDFVSWVVLLILLGLSVACWTLFLYKIMAVRAKIKQIQEVLAQLPQVKRLEDLLVLHSQYAKTAAGYLIIKNLKATEWFLELNATRGEQGISKHQAESLEAGAYALVDEMVQQEEAHLPLLSTSAAVSPLLGLFGTVWGLIQAFIAIGQKQSADIAAVAPGIAQALTTTLAGLLVAIPAFIMFNYLSLQIRTFENKLLNLSERIQLLIQRVLVR